MNKYSCKIDTASITAKGRQTDKVSTAWLCQCAGRHCKFYKCQSYGWNAERIWNVWSYLETLYVRKWRLRGWMLHKPRFWQSNTRGGSTWEGWYDNENVLSWNLFPAEFRAIKQPAGYTNLRSKTKRKYWATLDHLLLSHQRLVRRWVSEDFKYVGNLASMCLT